MFCKDAIGFILCMCVCVHICMHVCVSLSLVLQPNNRAYIMLWCQKGSFVSVDQVPDPPTVVLFPYKLSWRYAHLVWHIFHKWLGIG